MSFFAKMRAERLIADIKSSSDADATRARKALEKLGRLGPSALAGPVAPIRRKMTASPVPAASPA